MNRNKSNYCYRPRSLAKRGDNAFGRVRLSVCQSICLSIYPSICTCIYPLKWFQWSRTCYWLKDVDWVPWVGCLWGNFHLHCLKTNPDAYYKMTYKLNKKPLKNSTFQLTSNHSEMLKKTVFNSCCVTRGADCRCPTPFKQMDKQTDGWMNPTECIRRVPYPDIPFL